jgi:hypothetical protein
MDCVAFSRDRTRGRFKARYITCACVKGTPGNGYWIGHLGLICDACVNSEEYAFAFRTTTHLDDAKDFAVFHRKGGSPAGRIEPPLCDARTK